jgi:outer membrane protein W
MKNLMCFVLAGLFTISALQLTAQTEKGSLLLGGSSSLSPGSAGFRFSTTTARLDNGVDLSDNKSYGLNFSPAAGYFFADNLAVGMSLGIGFNGYKSGDSDTEWSNSFSLSPFFRYYVPLTDKVKPYAEARYSYFSSSSSFNSDERSNSNSVGGSIGTAFFISSKTSLDLFLNYNYLFSRDEVSFSGFPVDVKYNTSVLSFNVGFTFFL